MNLIKLLDIANPKKIKDTLNLLITTYDGFDDEIRSIAKAAQKDASAALNNSETALSTVDTANANASAAKQTSEEALTMIEAADQRSEEATQTAETALDNANTATQTAELAMNLATQAKSTVDQAISTGVFGTFVHNSAGISLLHAYLTNDINQEDTADNTYVATPTLVKNALANFDLSTYAKTTDLNAYLPLTGGQLTGALKIASGSDKGIQSADGDSILYINDVGEVFIRSESGDYIEIGGGAASVKIGGNKGLSDIDVIGRSFKYNDKSVAVKTDIPTKTSQLNNDSGFIDKNVNDLTNYLPLTGGTLTGTPMVKNNTILSYVNNEDTPIYLLSYSDYLNCIEVGNFGTPVHLIGSEKRPKYETSTTEDGGVELALLEDMNNYLPKSGGTLTGDLTISDKKNFTFSADTQTYSFFGQDGEIYVNAPKDQNKFMDNAGNLYSRGIKVATTTDIPDTSSFLKLESSSTQTISSSIRFSNNNIQVNQGIQDTSNNNIASKLANYITLGNTQYKTRIIGNSERPKYATSFSTGTSDLKDLALYSDIKSGVQSYLQSNGTTGGNTSGSLTLTAGHIYRLYVGMGDALLSCIVKMPNPMVEQYWFWGMNLYGHYCRLHISSAGAVTYQYANIGQNNWADNNSVYIQYEDLTSK